MNLSAFTVGATFYFLDAYLSLPLPSSLDGDSIILKVATGFFGVLEVSILLENCLVV
jgi:hypothetical protein